MESPWRGNGGEVGMVDSSGGGESWVGYLLVVNGELD